MNFDTKQTIQSEVHPGVEFDVLTLNAIQRARRDMEIADERLEYTRFMVEFNSLTPEINGSIAAKRADLQAAETELGERIGAEQADGQKIITLQGHIENLEFEIAELEKAAEVAESTLEGKENKRRREDLAYRMELILSGFIVPASLRASLIGIRGATVDGEPMTVAGLIASGDDAFITEVFERCEMAAGLVGDDSKNSQPPGISAGRTDGSPSDSTVQNASELAITATATVPVTSPVP